MKKIIIITLLFSTILNAQKIKNDWFKTGLKGKVKSFTLYRKRMSKKTQKLKKRFTLSFNKKGFLTTNKMYRDNGTVKHTLAHTYDKNGNLVKMKIDHNEYYLEYDENGNKIKLLINPHSNERWIFTYTYDENNNCIAESSFHHNKLESKKTFRYDEQKNIIEQKKYNSEQKLYSKEINKYDVKNHLIEKISTMTKKIL